MKKICLNLFLGMALLSPSGCKKKPGPVPLPEKALVPAPSISTGASRKPNPPARYAVIISIDGLGSEELSPLVEAGRLEAFSYLEKHGAWTREAVCDFTDSTTTANHTCMLTGLPSDPPMPNELRMHHGYHLNTDPPSDAVLRREGNDAPAYLPSIFDVAHDFGLKTCFFSGKSKFVLFTRSYDQNHGAEDRVGSDDGTNKMDVSVLPRPAAELADRFRSEALSPKPCELTFIHMAELDTVGHTAGWASDAWNEELTRLDGVLKKIQNAIESSLLMKNKTAVIVTADHGGVGSGHGDPLDKRIFKVPFYVMGPSIQSNVDLYSLYARTRKKSGDINPPYTAKNTPIRNGEVGNFALSLLGLPPVPGSVLYGMND